MNIAELISLLISKDIQVWTENGRLRINAPKGALTPELRDILTEQKDEIVEFLRLANEVRQDHRKEIHPTEHSTAAPLSFAQQRVWFLDQLDPGNLAFSIPLAVVVEGALDLALVERCLNAIVERHEALRTTFEINSTNTPTQGIQPFAPLHLETIDLQHVSQPEWETECKMVAEEKVHIPFDLNTGPLFRAYALRCSESYHWLIFNMHQMIADDRSMAIFFSEFVDLYLAWSKNQVPALAELSVQYADYAAWQQQWAKPELYSESLQYWKQKLKKPLPILEIPADKPRPAVQTFHGAALSIDIPSDLVAKIHKLSGDQDVTPFMVYMAALKALIYRYSGQEDVIVGSPVDHRDRPEIKNLIGFFENTLVLRTDLSGSPTFLELLDRVRDTVTQALTHQDLPFEMLVEAIRPERDTSHNPVYQAVFTYQDAPLIEKPFPGSAVKPYRLDTGAAKYDLSVTIQGLQEGAAAGAGLRFEYNTDLFEEGTISRMMRHYLNLLEAACRAPETGIHELALLGAAEQRLILEEWNATQLDYPRQRTLHQLFEDQVERTPARIAATFENQSITFRELDQRANQLAHTLRQMGVGPDQLVGICLERSIDLLTGLLGILKAGGAYLPLDPHFPAERLAYMLDDSQAPLLLTQQNLLGIFPDQTAARVCIDADWPVIARQPTERLPALSRPEHLLYTIYTSGSTGRPKGVQIQQHSVVNFLTSMRQEPGFSPADTLLSVTTLSFDIAGLELYLPLITGGHLALVSSDTATDGPQLIQALQDTHATVMQATPATWRMLLASGWDGSPDLTILCGGEAFPPDLAEALLSRCAGLWNLYGPTETTIWSTLARVTDPHQISIGRPIANTQVYLLDGRMQPVPIGVPGELFIGGDGVARGYLDRPEITAERFLPNPFRPGERIYRTGDLCRFRPDGQLEYVGRLDFQVKIRGFRIELGEIENVLVQHPAVHQAVVIAREDTPGDRRLAAYFVNAGEAPSTGELRTFLKQQLPDYMIPSFFMALPSLPLTPNGKVDRKALPAPEGSRPELGTTFISPTSPIEQALAEIWQSVLQVDRVGIHDNFFELGGHSLLIVQVHNQVKARFDTGLTIAQMFQYPTIQQLAVQIERSTALSGRPHYEPVDWDAIRQHTKRLNSDNIPLSFAQQRFWFLEQISASHTANNLIIGLRLDFDMDEEILERCLDEIIRRHETLHTSFKTRDDQPIAVIEPLRSFKAKVVDLRDLPSSVRDADLIKYIREESTQPFNLSQAPLFRAILIKLADQDSILLLTQHHIISDGTSTEILKRELLEMYEAFSKGQPSPLADLPVQYTDYVLWQQEAMRSQRLEDQLDYWKTQLAGELPRLELPVDHAWPTLTDMRGDFKTLSLTPDLSSKIIRLAKDQSITIFILVLAAFNLYLHRITGQEDIILGTPVWGRSLPEFERMIGLFLNTLVLRSDVSGNPTFQELLDRVKEVAVNAYANQDIPFERLVEELQPERSLNRNPIFDVLINLLPQKITGDGTGPSGASTYTELDSRFPLTFYIHVADGQIHFNFLFQKAIFSPERIACMADQLRGLLEQIVADPGQAINQYSLITGETRSRLPDPTIPLEQPEHNLLMEQVAKIAQHSPYLPAVRQGERTWTYAEFSSDARILAEALVRAGCAPGDTVSVRGVKSYGLIVSMLAALLSGGVLLTLDPLLPLQRQETMLKEARARWLLDLDSDDSLLDSLDLLSLVRLPVGPASGHASLPFPDPTPEIPLPSVHPNDPAYIFFTSGTTGVPKGVLGVHRGLSHFLDWQRRTFAIGHEDRSAQLTGLSFDVVLRDVFLPITSGACLCLPEPEDQQSPERLLTWMQRQKITFTHTVPAIVQTWLIHPPVGVHLDSLRWVFFAGEPLSDSLVQLWRDTFSNSSGIVNLYGPTETTLAKFYFTVPQVPLHGIQPVGRPLPQTQGLVINSAGQLCGISEPGEIYVRTPFRTLGYINAPDEQTRRFLPNPFGIDPNDLVYRTGDMGRYSADGSLEILGRQDDQVKLHGVRVELGEVAAVLLSHPKVKSAVVTAHKEDPGNPYLAAYVVAAHQDEVTSADLRQYLSEHLPAVMIPAVFMFLERLPLTQNGKVDRAALPAPTRVQSTGLHEQPRDVVEAKLLQIWRKLLGVDTIGVNDDFFALGGHSMMLVSLFAQIKEIFGVNLPLTSLFKKATIEHLAGLIEQQIGLENWSSITEIQPLGNRPPFFCIHGLTGDAFWFGHLVPYMDPEQPLWGLQSRGLDGVSQPLKTIEEMAALYIKEIQSIQAEGPYYIGGYSFGGSVAYEMACQLEEQGLPVGLLAILDHATPNSDYFKVRFTPSFVINMLKNLPYRVTDFLRLRPDQIIARVQRKLRVLLKRVMFAPGGNKKLMGNVSATDIIDEAPQLPEHIQKLIKENFNAITHYFPRSYKGNLTLLKARGGRMFVSHDPFMGWKKFAAQVDVRIIPGSHLRLFQEPHVQHLAKELLRCLEESQPNENSGSQ